ncbi:MAG: cob(I)yrinic acid a,c-diamide adenosyltransferase [Pseudomonadota bacterium]
MRITQVTTGVGDAGTTRLVGGQEVPKADPRVEAYGTVDELGASLGLARVFGIDAQRAEPGMAQVVALIEEAQHDLFVVAGELATLPTDRGEGMRRVSETDIARLEGHIARFNAELPPLEEFILAGGGVVAAHLHQARTLCRRAERRVAALAVGSAGAAEPLPLRYLNRLGDLLFVLARWTSRATGQAELLWRR